MKAQDQYRRALEKALGGPEQVVAAYRAWLSVSESGNDQVGKEKVAQASKWQKASDLARQAGFRALGESPKAYFESGCLETLVSDMRSIIRPAEGPRGQPSAVILDDRTLQSSCESEARAGYDGYKRRRGDQNSN